jgi:23S rRNA pseudouridine1911/1915/1917 synthase
VNRLPGEVRQSFTVEEGEEGERLDVWVSARAELSRTRVAQLLEEGKVLLDGAVPRKSLRVEEGMTFDVVVAPPVAPRAEAENLPLKVVWEDEHLLVVDKAAGMVVHPAPGHAGGTLVNALLHHVKDLSGIGGELRPGIVHRLDRDTSGLLVVAKGDRVHQELSRALKERQIRRIYRAAVWGHLSESPITIDAPIARDPRDRKRMAVIGDGRPALTRARVREQWTAADLLDVALGTGRTHQIRVHMLHIGHPVVGDAVYGTGRERGFGGDSGAWARAFLKRLRRQFLHAAELTFRHPVTGEVLRFQSDLPPDLAAAAAWARGEHPGA